MSNEAAARSNKISILLIIAIPLLGVVITTLYYFWVVNYNIKLGSTNVGTLIAPPKQIGDITLLQENHETYRWNSKGDKWTFLVVGLDECDDDCRQQLYLTRQIRLALGKYMPRIEDTYLSLNGTVSEETRHWMQQEHPQLQLLTTDSDVARAWFQQKEPQLDLLNSATFYVVDPMGWVMMYYTPEQDYKAVIKDMKFLLKNS